MLAFQIDVDPGYVYVGHSPSVFPAVPGQTSAFDNKLCVLVGNNLRTSACLVLEDNAFQRTSAIRCHTRDHITGADMYGAAPAVYSSGPHATSAPDTSEVRVRPAFLMQPVDAAAAISTQASGRYTLRAFYDNFIRGHFDAGGDEANRIASLIAWWRAASTLTTGGPTSIGITPIASMDVIAHQALTRWVTRVREDQMARLGIGGPGLSSAAFSLGLNQLQTTIRDTHTENLQFQRDRTQKSFTDKHGATLAQMLYNWTNVDTDDTLPEIHRLLAAAPKDRTYGIVSEKLLTRTATSPVPLTDTNAPIVTTKMIDEIYRGYRWPNSGQEFAAGLSPFAVVCEGHSEARDVRHKIHKAVLAEGGTSITLADADTLTSTDVRFPTQAHVAAEKLYGWSVHVDILFGSNHPLADSVRELVLCVCPMFNTLVTNAATVDDGMDMIHRVMFEAQQDFFMWMRQCARADDPATRPAIPDFQRIKSAVTSLRADSLSAYPSTWKRLLTPSPATPSTGPSRSPPRAATFNSDADQELMNRFAASEYTSVGTMMDGKGCTIPRVNGKQVCLVWALKGACTSGCKRKDVHVRYSAGINKAIGALLTKCGVAGGNEE